MTAKGYPFIWLCESVLLLGYILKIYWIMVLLSLWGMMARYLRNLIIYIYVYGDFKKREYLKFFYPREKLENSERYGLRALQYRRTFPMSYTYEGEDKEVELLKKEQAYKIEEEIYLQELDRSKD